MRAKNKICLFLLALSYGVGYKCHMAREQRATVAGAVVADGSSELVKSMELTSGQEDKTSKKGVRTDPSVFEDEMDFYNRLVADSLPKDAYHALLSGNQDLPQFNFLPKDSSWGIVFAPMGNRSQNVR